MKPKNNLTPLYHNKFLPICFHEFNLILITFNYVTIQSMIFIQIQISIHEWCIQRTLCIYDVWKDKLNIINVSKFLPLIQRNIIRIHVFNIWKQKPTECTRKGHWLCTLTSKVVSILKWSWHATAQNGSSSRTLKW